MAASFRLALLLCRRIEEIEASRAPQILKIEHGDTAVELSDAEDSDECSGEGDEDGELLTTLNDDDVLWSQTQIGGHDETLPATASSQ